jgi:hypothetical protein
MRFGQESEGLIGQQIPGFPRAWLSVSESPILLDMGARLGVLSDNKRVWVWPGC